MSKPVTLSKNVSPPPTRKRSSSQITTITEQRHQTTAGDDGDKNGESTDVGPSVAAVEAGVAQIRDHLEYFTNHFREIARPVIRGPRLSIEDFQSLYKRNQHRHGRHFVVHQHDHPVSGVHYDLRLQFSESSTVSFAVPYGLPGNPNSVRPNRMAIETRVHTLWNNLIESASHATGSLLIWDTGEYDILPWKARNAPSTDDELSDVDESDIFDGRTQSERLFDAFQARHIRLRLHGTRLPSSYTVSLRLPTANNYSRQPKKPTRKRRRVDPVSTPNDGPATSSESEINEDTTEIKSNHPEDDNEEADITSDEDEHSTIRANNAYTGATNTIGSIHQRNWFLTLDRRSSGFRKARRGPDEGRWVGDWEPFFVYGRDHERSVVTGRNADEVMEDEDVEKFVGRKMWRPILE